MWFLIKPPEVSGELNHGLRRYNGRRYLDIHFLRSVRGVRMSQTLDILNRMICEIDDGLLKAKAQLEYLEDKELIDDAMEKTLEALK